MKQNEITTVCEQEDMDLCIFPVEPKINDPFVKREIEEMLESLRPRECHVLQMRFGFKNELSYRELGKRLGITGSRVREIERGAIRKLRHRYRGKSINDYL